MLYPEYLLHPQQALNAGPFLGTVPLYPNGAPAGLQQTFADFIWLAQVTATNLLPAVRSAKPNSAFEPVVVFIIIPMHGDSFLLGYSLSDAGLEGIWNFIVDRQESWKYPPSAVLVDGSLFSVPIKGQIVNARVDERCLVGQYAGKRNGSHWVMVQKGTNRGTNRGRCARADELRPYCHTPEQCWLNYASTGALVSAPPNRVAFE